MWALSRTFAGNGLAHRLRRVRRTPGAAGLARSSDALTRDARAGSSSFSGVTLWDATRVTSFQTAAVVLGALLVAASLLSGLARRSVLSLTALFVLAGFILGQGVTGVLDFKANSGLVTDLATVALIVILFRDGLEIG